MKYHNVETAEDLFTGFGDTRELEENLDGIENKLWELERQIRLYKNQVEKLEKETAQLKDWIFKLIFELI